MDESSLFHYASDSPLGPNGTGGRDSCAGTGVAKQGESFTQGMKATELMDISSPSKLNLRISATLQPPGRDKQELPCVICPFLLLFFLPLHFLTCSRCIFHVLQAETLAWPGYARKGKKKIARKGFWEELSGSVLGFLKISRAGLTSAMV